MISNKDMNHISSAMDAACRSSMKFRHGACVVMGGKCIAVGANSVLDAKLDSWSMHAEINALKRSCHQLKGMRSN